MIVNGIEVDEEKAQRMIKKIIIMEKRNLRDKKMSDPKVVDKIKAMIEEEVKCY